jgi:outer membrane protein assembly factor BamB
VERITRRSALSPNLNSSSLDKVLYIFYTKYSHIARLTPKHSKILHPLALIVIDVRNVSQMKGFVMVPVSRFKGVLGVALLLVCLIGVATLGSPQFAARASGGSPSITLSPNSGPPTTQVTVKGTGFGPSEQVVITVDNNPDGKAKTNKQGNFSAKITIPKDYGPGPTPVQATGQSSGLTAQATFTINTDWPSFGFDPQNTGYNPYENVLSPSDAQFLILNWTYQQGKRLATSTSVVKGVLYLSGGGGRDKGTLEALDAQTGKLIWKSNLVLTETAVANGVVYGGSSEGNVYALDANTGSLIWSYQTNSVPVYSPPTVVNGVVYIEADDGVYALDAQAGTLIWKYTINTERGSPTVANGVVYFGATANNVSNVYALDAQTGTLIWKYKTGILVAATAAVANGLVYIGSGAGIVYALNARTGALKWSYQTGGIVASAPAVANGIVYVGSFDHYLYALNAQTGALVWKYNTGEIIYYASPIVANGVVYVGASGSKQLILLALDAQQGTMLWSYNRRGSTMGGPIVANGFFYIGLDKIMYAFSLPGLKS